MAAKVTAMDPRLDAFLEAAAETGHVWGKQDCALFGANWALALTGVDPANGVRGLYHDEAGAKALMTLAGGLTLLADRMLTRAGWRARLVTPARQGDLGVVLMRGPKGPEPVGAIALGGLRWAIIGPSSVRFVRAPALKAWRWPRG